MPDVDSAVFQVLGNVPVIFGDLQQGQMLIAGGETADRSISADCMAIKGANIIADASR